MWFSFCSRGTERWPVTCCRWLSDCRPPNADLEAVLLRQNPGGTSLLETAQLMGDENPTAPAPKSFWQRRVVGLLVAQLKQGITPEKIALTIALGLTLGIFPIMGTTTVLCAIVGIWLKLNQPIIQVVNYVIYPVQISLILVFVRMGEWMTRAERVPFSIPELMRKFQASPAKFMQEFGVTGLHAIIGWLAVAPALIVVIYYGLRTPMRKLAGATTPSTSSHVV